MNHVQDLVNSMISRAQKLSNNFNTLLQKASCLLAESESVQQKFIDCRGVQEDQLLKNLVKYCNDDECIQQLLENAELKRTVEEYKDGVKTIMAKYKHHCGETVLSDSFNLRERYVSNLQQVVDRLEERLDQMTLIMLYTVGLDDDNSKENEHIIQQLTKDNAEMRRKLQIHTSSSDFDFFQQGLPLRIDSGTQIEEGEPVQPDSLSVNSESSFLTCFSSGLDGRSADISLNTDLEEEKLN